MKTDSLTAVPPGEASPRQGEGSAASPSLPDAARPPLIVVPPAPPPPKGARRIMPWLILAVVAGCMGAGIFLLVKRAKNAAEDSARSHGLNGKDRPNPVVVAQAVTGNLPIYIDGLGTVTPLNTVTVRSRVDGQIQKVWYTEGQQVKAGDPLVDIDPRPYQVVLEQAQGQLQKDQATLANARLDLTRYEQASTAVTQQQIDTQKATVDQDEGVVKTDQGQIDSAKLNIEYCHITAPINGRTGLRLVDEGNIIHASDTTGLVVINQLQPIDIVFTVPQADIPRVTQGQADGNGEVVDAYDPALATKLATGKLVAIDNQVDTTTETVKLKAEFPNDQNNLFPNQFVNVKLLVQMLKNVVLVPTAAVQTGPNNKTFIYVMSPGPTTQPVVEQTGRRGGAADTQADPNEPKPVVHDVAVRDVKVGPVQGERSAILSGIVAGEIVVTDGVDKLEPGSRVTARQGGTAGGGTHAHAATEPTALGAADAAAMATQASDAANAGSDDAAQPPAGFNAAGATQPAGDAAPAGQHRHRKPAAPQ